MCKCVYVCEWADVMSLATGTGLCTRTQLSGKVQLKGKVILAHCICILTPAHKLTSQLRTRFCYNFQFSCLLEVFKCCRKKIMT